MHDPHDRGTFSIVACDVEGKYWGVAVSTKPASVGALVPWGEWRVGALATQAWYNYFYGPKGLELLRLDSPRRTWFVDSPAPIPEGRRASWVWWIDKVGPPPGPGRSAWNLPSTRRGRGTRVKATSWLPPPSFPAMAKAFESTRGTLASRMLRALKAGAKEGGDRRGMESAALMVYHRERWTPWHTPDFWVNLRVDRHPRPIGELERLLRLDEAETRRYLAQRAAEARKRKKSRS